MLHDIIFLTFQTDSPFLGTNVYFKRHDILPYLYIRFFLLNLKTDFDIQL